MTVRSVSVQLITSDGDVLQEVEASQWDAAKVLSALEAAKWVDVSQQAGYSDFTTDIDAREALRLFDLLQDEYLAAIATRENIARMHYTNANAGVPDQRTRSLDPEQSDPIQFADILKLRRSTKPGDPAFKEAFGLWRASVHSQRTKHQEGPFDPADEYAVVAARFRAELAELQAIVRRAAEQAMTIRLLIEEW